MKFLEYIKSKFSGKAQDVVPEANDVSVATNIQPSRCGKIRFYSEFPFSVSDKDVIYIEPFYDAERNRYIREHYDEMCARCESMGCRFIYLPKDLTFLFANHERLRYNLPGCGEICLDGVDVKPMAQRIYNLYYRFIRTEAKVDLLQPVFLCTRSKYSWSYCEAKGDIACLWCDDIEPVYEDSGVRFRVSSLDNDNIRYCLDEELDDSLQADWDFCDEIEKLKEEILVRIEQLRTYGVDDVIIKELFAYKPQLSRLVVTDDYRIVLSDYGIEIKMAPLIKAVYLLFLRHKEGIWFKNLVDYRGELLSIYNHITRFDDSERIERSIDLLVDSTNNSINEKCSRIREAFVSQFNDEIAKSYYITGGRLEPKRIELDRSLVVWECEL